MTLEITNVYFLHSVLTEYMQHGHIISDNKTSSPNPKITQEKWKKLFSLTSQYVKKPQSISHKKNTGTYEKTKHNIFKGKKPVQNYEMLATYLQKQENPK